MAEPTWHTPSSLKSIGLSPEVITGLFKDVLERHFSDTTTLQQPSLRSFQWQNNESTGIRIESAMRFDVKNTDQFPAILIEQGELQTGPLGINSGVKMGYNRDVYNYKCVGSHVIHCLGADRVSADLATEVRRFINQYTPMIRQCFKLGRLIVNGQSAPQLQKEASANARIYQVSVSLSYEYIDTWEINRKGPPIRKFYLDIGT